MAETLEGLQLQEKVIITEPAEGWSPPVYRRELDEYMAAHGRAPQTVTMHPDTMAALQLSAELGDPTPDENTPLLVTSRDYDRAIITFYY